MAVTDLGQLIYYLLANNAGVSAITSRIYPGDLPQSPEYPAIRYMQVTGADEYSLSGSSGHAHVRYQIEAWAATYAGARALSAAIKTLLSGYVGKTDTVRIRSCLLDSERDMYEPDVNCHRVVMDYMLWWHIET